VLKVATNNPCQVTASYGCEFANFILVEKCLKKKKKLQNIRLQINSISEAKKTVYFDVHVDRKL
jgi:hypothetical protein